MSKVSIVYWSGTGNTQKMAEAVAEGVKEAGAEADLKFVSAATVDELAAEPAFALGCPSMGAEELEDAEMEPFMAELESKISGKKIALFGSYGWGGGEWMRTGILIFFNASTTSFLIPLVFGISESSPTKIPS